MKAVKSRDWLQVFANFSIAAGLVLLAVEINQNALIARAQLASDSWERAISTNQTIQNSDFAAVWAKSLERPEGLTLAEMVQIDGFLFSVVDRVEADYFLYEVGVFEVSDDEEISELWFLSGFLARSKYTYAWWNTVKSGYSPDFVAGIDNKLSSFSFGQRMGHYVNIKAKLKELNADDE